MTFEAFQEHCLKHKDSIPVREQVDGKWGTFYLSELPQERVNYWIQRWWNDTHKPVRLKE